MNSRLRLLIFVALVVGLLAAFNPGLEEFNAYIQKQIQISGNPSDESVRDLLSGISTDALKEGQKQGAVRKDYVICSIFEIRDASQKKVQKVLGFAKKIFIPLKALPRAGELKGEF